MRGAGWILAGVALALAGGWAAAPRGLAAPITDGSAGEDALAALRARLARGETELAAARAREDELEGELNRLRTALEEEQKRRAAREQEWLEFTRALASLPLPEQTAAPDQPAFLPTPDPIVGPSDAERAALAAAETAAQARALRARNDLNALLIAEHVFALDFLELGRVHDGWAGPLVVRQLDERGRLIGTLAADRLRIEASRAGRTVTLVFEVGWESHGGVRVPFGTPDEPGSERGGIRRVHLPGVDPSPWIETLPELLDPEDLRPPPDDGRWNLVELRLVLDERLRADSPGGRWRLIGVGGVMGGTLMDVHLAEVEPDGRITRRVFADGMRVQARGRGLELALEDGVIERAGEKAPFLDGRYRLFLPDARAAVWAAAGVPGLSAPPARGGR